MEVIYISHRGNINGKNPHLENNPSYIDEAIDLGYDVEIDLWFIDGRTYLGHDGPQYEVDDEWFANRANKLWVHCKNTDSLNWIRNTILHYFWHEEDTLTLTSKQYMWVYPGKQPIIGSVAVMPEISNDDVSKCIGICSDVIKQYKDEKSSSRDLY
jgi:hypothetical protein